MLTCSKQYHVLSCEVIAYGSPTGDPQTQYCTYGHYTTHPGFKGSFNTKINPRLAAVWADSVPPPPLTEIIVSSKTTADIDAKLIAAYSAPI